MSFNFSNFNIEGPILITPQTFNDERGFFLELYKRSEFINNGIIEDFVQDNYSQSSQGTLRGLHYQINSNAQGKLVTCLKGKIFDVAVDIRKDSPNYGNWISVELSEYHKDLLYIPPGFAHGFQVMTTTAQVMYKCTKEYSSEDSQGIIWDDKDLNIRWPLGNPILSDKDQKNLSFKNIIL